MLVLLVIPTYQKVRDSALISRMVRQLVGYARSCATFNASGLPADLPGPDLVSQRYGGVRVISGCDVNSRGAVLQATWGEARAEGVRCIEGTTTNLSRKATIVIELDSSMFCFFED